MDYNLASLFPVFILYFDYTLCKMKTKINRVGVVGSVILLTSLIDLYYNYLIFADQGYRRAFQNEFSQN
jgi:hypothetical protein